MFGDTYVAEAPLPPSELMQFYTHIHILETYNFGYFIIF